MSSKGIHASFVDGTGGKIFVTTRLPERETGTSVLIVPPFAEEMNKSRKMLADVARQLASRGIATILPDLLGTGDSEGEFRDGDWEIWKSDLASAAGWAATQGWPVSALLCMRLGCALGAAVARESLPGIERTVFWQPVTDGQRFLTQFLRLRVVVSMMEEGAGKETVADLRASLRNGAVLEVSGYEISPRLADQLDEVQLGGSMGRWLGELLWVEVVRSESPSLSGSVQQALERARQAALSISVCNVIGEPFWSSTEIVRLPDLVARTVEALAPAR